MGNAKKESKRKAGDRAWQSENEGKVCLETHLLYDCPLILQKWHAV
jgi:hypothetical protein